MTLPELCEKKAVVHCYWNFHKKLWSVRYKGKVIDHALSVHLKDVLWTVQPAGNARVRREGRKNIHAYCKGEITGFSQISHFRPTYEEVSVMYNPYKYETFVFKSDHKPIMYSEKATLTGKNAYASPPTYIEKGEKNDTY